MRGYLDKTLLAANTDLTVSPKTNPNNNDVFLENFHLEFTTAASTTPRSFDDESLAAEKNQIDEEMCFAIMIVFLFCIGVFINIGCLVSLRRHRSTFHRFLKMLACFDALVVTCIFLMYALPVLAPWYKKTIFLPMVPFFLPVVHMALMGSVYSTIVMSLERYLRLCRMQNMSKRCGTVWCLIVVLFPAVFYFPKFFEYRYQKFEHDFPIPINCSQFVLEQRELQEIDNAIQWVSCFGRVVKTVIAKIRFSRLFFQSSKVTVSGGRIRPKIPNPKSEELKSAIVNLEIPPPLYDYPMECFDFDFALYNTSDNFIRTVREKRTVYYPNATEIRRNPYYYTIYCVALNTCFATLLPLAALIYLNCMTLRALRSLVSQQTNSTQNNSRQLDTIEEENSQCSGPIIHSLKSSGLEKKPGEVNRFLSSRTTPLARTNTYSSERFVRGTRFICGFDNQSSSFGGLDGNAMNVRYVIS